MAFIAELFGKTTGVEMGSSLTILMDQTAIGELRAHLVVERLPKMRSGITLGSAVRRIADGVDFAVPATIEDASVIEDLRAAPADDQSGAVSYGGTAKPHRATTTHNPPTKESEHGI